MYKINSLIFPKLNIQMVLLKVEAPTVVNNSIYKNKKKRPLKQTLGLKIIKYISIRRFYGKHCIYPVLFKDFK